jgi:hypothetical protein
MARQPACPRTRRVPKTDPLRRHHAATGRHFCILIAGHAGLCFCACGYDFRGTAPKPPEGRHTPKGGASMQAEICDSCGVVVAGDPPLTGSTNGSPYVLSFSVTLRSGTHLCRTCFVRETTAVVAAANGRAGA